MKTFQSHVEKFYSDVLLRYPAFVAVLLLAVVALFGIHATNYKVDASADTLVLEGDEDLEFYREISRRYESEDFLVIAYQPNDDLLDDTTLAALADLVAALEVVNGVSSVISILDVPLLYSPKIAISEIAKGIPTLRNPDVDRQLVAEELVESPIYNRLLSSVDGDTTAMQVNLERDEHAVELLEARETLRAQVREGDDGSVIQHELKLAEQAYKEYSTIAAERHQALVATVRDILDQHRKQYSGVAKQIYLGGVPMIASDMIEYVKSDLAVFGTGVLLFMIVLLSIIFRALRWVVLPVVACVAVNVFMLGYLGWVDWRMTVVSSNFVALMLILSLAIAIHLIVRYRELETLNPAASHRQLAAKAAALMISPCVFTSLTTLVAFVSLVISGIRPIIDFGLMMTIGVVAALVFTFFIVPLGMVLLPSRKSPGESASATAIDELVTEAEQEQENSHDGVFTLRFARITESFGKSILWVSALLVVLSVLGILQLKVENRFIDYFDESTEIYQGMELIDAELGGTIPLDIILFSEAHGGAAAVDDSFAIADDEFDEDEFDDDFGDEFSDEFEDGFDDEFGGEENSSNTVNQWFTRAGLQKIQTIHQHVDSLEETGKVLSLATIYEVAGDLLGGNVDDIQLALAYQSLPDVIRGILIEPYLNTDQDEARISVRVKETSRTLNRSELLSLLDNYLQTEIGLEPEQYRLSGMLVLYNNMLQSLFKSQILTLGVVFVAITFMLTLLFRSLFLAILAVAPNLLAALMVLGGMGWVGLPLDMMTITIAAISIGIGVDNTIHYVHRFKLEFQQDRNYLNTMYRCHGSIGRAMYYTSITIIFGFSILALSNFKPSIYFGLLTGAAMFSALIGALMLLPRLLIVFKPLGAESQVGGS